MLEFRSRQLRSGPLNHSFVYPNYDQSLTMTSKDSSPLGNSDLLRNASSAASLDAQISSALDRQESLPLPQISSVKQSRVNWLSSALPGTATNHTTVEEGLGDQYIIGCLGVLA